MSESITFILHFGLLVVGAEGCGVYAKGKDKVHRVSVPTDSQS